MTDDHVVIVGLAVEAPGGITTPAAYWTALTEGREVVGPLPTDRGWDLELLAGLGDREGWSPVPDAGGFLDDAATFDPAFFGISPREAIAMDPQQRVALRVAWRALENAGIRPETVAGPDTGCFLGANINDYGPSMATLNDHNGYLLGGTSLSAVAGRVSHCLRAAGPSLTVDTGCAASLTAVHLAVNALRLGECDLALAGGVTVMGSEMLFVEFAKSGALSSTGHCRPFSANRAGTVWSEGAGVVVRERAGRARRESHRILGRVAAVGTNHNGGGAAMIVPGETGQRQVIERTLDRGGIAPESVGLIEGHGTATEVGDPIELSALGATYGSVGAPTPLGSVKSNLGHTQAAAGVLGLAKVLLCGGHGRIAPTLFDDIPALELPPGLQLPSSVEPWEPVDGVRRAAVSSFGIGGTNTHLVVEMEDAHG